MLGSKQLRLISVAIILMSFYNLLFIGSSKADSLAINGSNQMSTGGTQTMTASGGCGSYSWGIAVGSGRISGTTSDSATYTAPTSNASCANNPIMCVTDSCGQKACVQIAVNAFTGSDWAYGTYSKDYCNYSGTHNEWGLCVACQKTYNMYHCNGSQNPYDPNRYCTNVVWRNWTCGHGQGETDCSYCYLSTPWVCNPMPHEGINDFRTPSMIQQGCCPAGLPGGDSGGANGSGGTDNGTNDKGGGDSGNGTGSGSSSGSGSGGSNNAPCSNSPNVKTDSEANLKSGNLYHSQDVAGLAFSYNSIDTYSGPLGQKWTHSYDLKLEASSDNATLILKQADGNIAYFRLSGGIYYPEAISGDTSQIVKNSNGTYTQTAKNGVVHEFNTSGLLTSIRDRNSNATTLTYSGSNLASITDKNGRATTITSISGKITGITDPAGRNYTLAYTGSLLTSITDPLGNVWLFTYDAAGRMLTKKDPGNNTITYTYNAAGKLLTSTDPEGKTRTMNYTLSGSSTFTEKDGGVWIYTYDPVYAVKTAKTDPLGNITRYIYDLKRNLIKTTHPDGSFTSYTYDTNGNMTSVTDPVGKITTYTYNSLYLITSVTDPKGHITQYGYDAKGNLTSITDAANGVTQYQYDTKGNITAIINPLGRTTFMTYDLNNNLRTVTDPKSGTVTMTYDSMGNMLTQMDALGNVTTFQYNSLNQMTQVTDPLGNITHYTYDTNGNRLSATDANSNTTQYAYDYKGKITEITDALNNSTKMAYGSGPLPLLRYRSG